MKKVLLFLCVIAVTLVAYAGPNPDTEKTEDKTEKADTTAPAPSKPGLFGVLHEGEDWFFDVPDSLLGRRILVVTILVMR